MRSHPYNMSDVTNYDYSMACRALNVDPEPRPSRNAWVDFLAQAVEIGTTELVYDVLRRAIVATTDEGTAMLGVTRDGVLQYQYRESERARAALYEMERQERERVRNAEIFSVQYDDDEPPPAYEVAEPPPAYTP